MTDAQPPGDRIRAVIVDADRRVRDGLTGLFAIGDQVEVVGWSDHPGAAIDTVAATHPDVVIIDPRLPDVDAGLGLLPILQAASPRARIIVMNWQDSLESAFLAAGADGFLDMCAPPSRLVEAVVAAVRHGGRPS
jgi:DNA-binding NarL/FixJ family response regulator